MLENMVRIRGSVEYVHEPVEITVNVGNVSHNRQRVVCARPNLLSQLQNWR